MRLNNENDHSMFKSVLREAEKLRKRKFADYGRSYASFGELGVVVRMSDKMARISNIYKNKRQAIKIESIRDTAIDLANYSIMLVMLLDEKTKER